MTAHDELTSTTEHPDTQALPRLIGSAELQPMLRLGRTTFYKAIAEPGFPTPIQLIDGGVYLWYLDEVLAYLETRRRHPAEKAASDPAPVQRRLRENTEPTVGVRPGRSERRRRGEHDRPSEVTVRSRRAEGEVAA